VSKLFLDVSGNKELVDGYQIEDSIAQKYDLKPGSICPFTGFRVEILSPQQIRAAERAERRKIIKQQRIALGKEKQKLESHFARKQENLSAARSKISGDSADIKTTKSIHLEESHDFARGRARAGRGPVKRNRTIEREEVRMATAKKVPAKPVKPAKAAAQAPAKTKTPVKAPVKAAAKPAKAKAKAVAKAPTKAKVKAKAKAPVKAKAVAKKPAAKKPVKTKK
jgi:hypothetical protein